MVNFDKAEGIVMTAVDLITADEVTGNQGFIDAHGEIVSDGEYGKIQFGAQLRDEFHIHGQGRITRMVKTNFVVPDHKPARVAGVAAVGKGAGVDSVHVLDRTKVEFPFAAVIHGMPFDAFIFVPGLDLVIGDHFGPGSFGYTFCIRYMIAVAVRQQDVVSGDAVDVDLLSQWVGGDKRIKEEMLAFGGDPKAGLAVISDLHSLDFFLEAARR